MYYDIIHQESVDEFGNKIVSLVPVTVAPPMDDIAPSDMSLTNQLKAGVKLQQVRGKSKPSLESSDSAEQSIFENGEKVSFEQVSDPIPPSPQPSPQPSPEPSSEPKSE